MGGLLDGMRVLDLSSWRPMPHATQILADLGADVLKVEPPGGDPMRAYPEIFASVARGKRSIVLDLKTETGRARAWDLAVEADVVCESWRPGVAEGFGLHHDALAAANPSVISCSLTGYGQDGPLRSVPGHDVNFQAIGGALAPRHDGDRDPEVPRLPVADLESGTLCALLIVAAWSRRLQTGVGERIDVAMADVVAWWVGTTSGTARAGDDAALASGAFDGRGDGDDAAIASHSDSGDGDGDGSEPVARTFGSPGYGVFRTRDGGWIALGVLSEQRLWAAICAALSLDSLADLDFAQRLARTTEIDAALAAAVGLVDRDAAIDALLAAGAPASAVLRPEEVAGHPHFAARGVHVATAAGVVAALPALLGNAGATPARATEIPGIGAHPNGFLPR